MAHRKLTERERDRMLDMCASGPLDYTPSIDNNLILMDLVRWWDGMWDAVEHNPDMPFFADNGSILPEWYDFRAKERGEPRAVTFSTSYVIEGVETDEEAIEQAEERLARYFEQCSFGITDLLDAKVVPTTSHNES